MGMKLGHVDPAPLEDLRAAEVVNNPGSHRGRRRSIFIVHGRIFV
jgi:hypothetical protein